MMINDKELMEALRSCILALRCDRGSFYPNKDYGNELRAVTDRQNQKLILALARQAVSEIDGVFIKSVTLSDNTAVFNILINDNREQVIINFEQDI